MVIYFFMLNFCFGCLHHMMMVYISDISAFLAASIFREEMSRVINCSVCIGRQSFGPMAEGEGVSVWFSPMGVVFTKTLTV